MAGRCASPTVAVVFPDFCKPELAGTLDRDQIEGKAEMRTDFEDRFAIFDTLIFHRF